MRVLMILALAGDLWLLLESRSRPGYLAMLASAFVIVPFAAHRFRWKLAAILLAGIGIIYFGKISGFAARLDDLAANFQQDERWEIWLEAFRLQQQSSWPQWLFGHGLGQYELDYQATAAAHGIIYYLAPHNFIMEILYSHGLTGLVVIGVSYAGFLTYLARVTRDHPTEYGRRFGLMLLSVATAQVVHGYFTIPFFSRDYLIPLGLLLGVSFVYGSLGRRSD
jgi:O-antigen ligase